MPEDQEIPSAGEFLLYTTEDGKSRVECRFENETIWLSQALMAELFETSSQNITLHLKALVEDDERRKNSDIAGTSTVPDYFDEILSSNSERNQSKLPRATIWKPQTTANNGKFNNSLSAA